jgi:hypothetical protein
MTVAVADLTLQATYYQKLYAGHMAYRYLIIMTKCSELGFHTIRRSWHQRPPPSVLLCLVPQNVITACQAVT